MSLIDLFSALADPTRCHVVELLRQKNRPVHELAAAFEISRPAISRHLKVLKDAGLVKEEKSGRENVYSLQRAKLRPMQDWLEKQRATEKKPGRAKVAVALAAPKGRGPKRAPVTHAAPTMPVPAAAPQLSFFDL